MKTTKNLLALLTIALFTATFTSCEKDEDSQTDVKVSTGLVVLNQGKYKGNNASLSYYDFGTSLATSDFFNLKNSRGLGDTGQDIIVYGSKIYIAVYGSSLIEVIDANSGISKKSIPMLDGSNQPSSPRALASYNGKIYISLFNGNVAQLDTATLTVEKTVKVGANPEGIVAANNKIYVANSGGLSSVQDSTISVINPTTFTVEKTIVVGLNPGKIVADAYGDLYVISNGNYYDVPVTLKRVEKTTNKVTTVENFSPFGMTLDGDNLYLFSYGYDENWNVANKKYIVYNVKSETIANANFIATDAIAKVPYSIDVNPVTKDVFIGESDYLNNGKMYCFSSAGILKYTFTTGLNPAKTVFITK